MKTLERTQSKREPGRFTVIVMLEQEDRGFGPGDEVGLEAIGVCRILAMRPLAGPLPGVKAEDRVLTMDVVRTVTGPDVDDLPYRNPSQP